MRHAESVEILDKVRLRITESGDDDLLQSVVNEIERLLITIDCYSRSSAAAAQEINWLRLKLEQGNKD